MGWTKNILRIYIYIVQQRLSDLPHLSLTPANLKQILSEHVQSLGVGSTAQFCIYSERRETCG